MFNLCACSKHYINIVKLIEVNLDTVLNSTRKSQSHSVVDYSVWRDKEYWSLSEAAKLICGRNPYDKIPTPQLYNKGVRVIDIIDRAFEAAQKGEMKVVRNGVLAVHSMVEPASFVHWAIDFGLEVPEQLKSMQKVNFAKNPALKEAMLRERVSTIARTLWIIEPQLTVGQIARHPAMLRLAPEDIVSSIDRLRWIEETQESI